MRLTQKDLEQLDRKYRLNLINSITGIKPANLVGTRSQDGLDNVAIFSSVVHLGSNPAQLGLVMRPQTDGIKDTYANIQATKQYTINHISQPFIQKAHYTSAKLPREQSEFDIVNLKREFIGGFHAPFVAESHLKMGMNLVDILELPNGCLFIIGEIAMIDFPDKAVNDLGYIDLSEYKAVGISGLNSYYALEPLESFPYVRENEIPDFE